MRAHIFFVQIVLSTVFLSFHSAYCQTGGNESAETSISPKPDLSPPEFNWKGMRIETFIRNNLRYPDSLKLKGIKGRFMIQFTVDTSGHVSKISCKDSVSQLQQVLLDEAIRVIKLTDGKWKPAMLNGKKTKMQMRIPIRFELAD